MTNHGINLRLKKTEVTVIMIKRMLRIRKNLDHFFDLFLRTIQKIANIISASSASIGQLLKNSIFTISNYTAGL
jgi:hypothetical protein